MSRVPVFYETHLVGNVVVGDEGEITFEYGERWRATHNAFPVSLAMPLSRAVHPSNVVRPWLANLLPEESQLTALSQALGVAPSDSLALLSTIGGDTAGALSFAEPSDRTLWGYETLTARYRVADEQEALRLHFEELATKPLLAGEDGVRQSLAGGQSKSALAVLDASGAPKLGLPEQGDTLALPLNGAPSTVILKPDNPRLEGIVENEAYCLALASAAGLRAANATIVPAVDRAALLVARYDRTTRPDGSLRRLHQEDFAQTLSLFPEQKYERGTIRGPSLVQLLQVGRRLPSRDALQLIDQVIYNILVANTDAHAKNYSLLLGRTPNLAPLYDVSSVLLWPALVNQYHAQNIAGKKRKPGNTAPRHWNSIAQEAGLNPRQIKLRIEQLVDKIVETGLAVAKETGGLPAASVEIVEHVYDQIEANALRILGRPEEDVPENLAGATEQDEVPSEAPSPGSF